MYGGTFETRYGRRLENVVVTLLPQDVTSFAAAMGAPIYDGGPSAPVDFGAMLPGHPRWDAWLGCRYCAQIWGTQTTGNFASRQKSNKYCGTVWVDDYQPMLSIPPQFTSLQSDWVSRSCQGIFAFWDPPKVLTQQTAAATPSLPTVPSLQSMSSAAPAATLRQSAPRTSEVPRHSSALGTPVPIATTNSQSGTMAVDDPNSTIAATLESTNEAQSSSQDPDPGILVDPLATSSEQQAAVDEPALTPITSAVVSPLLGPSSSEISEKPYQASDELPESIIVASPTDAIGVLSQALSQNWLTTGPGDYVASGLGLSASVAGPSSPIRNSLTSVADATKSEQGSTYTSKLYETHVIFESEPGYAASSIVISKTGPLASSALLTDTVDTQQITINESVIIVATYQGALIVDGTTMGIDTSDAAPGLTHLDSMNGQALTLVPAGSLFLVEAATSTALLSSGGEITFEGKTVSQSDHGALVDGTAATFSQLSETLVPNNGPSHSLLTVGGPTTTAGDQPGEGFQSSLSNSPRVSFPASSVEATVSEERTQSTDATEPVAGQATQSSVGFALRKSDTLYIMAFGALVLFML
ncbi:hypothetical protein LTR17_016587 [Elasticomyces elasticus]|nr:hypothetical protein LTR17_016587 [Elasticomyces elasticus]